MSRELMSPALIRFPLAGKRAEDVGDYCHSYDSKSIRRPVKDERQCILQLPGNDRYFSPISLTL